MSARGFSGSLATWPLTITDAQAGIRAIPSDDVFEPLEEPSEMNRIAEASVVQDALMELPDHHREVIVEAFFAGRTCRQIAERLGIPTGTVKSRL